MLVQQHGAGIVIGGCAFHAGSLRMRKDIDVLLLRGELPNEDVLDVFYLKQLLIGGDTCWVNNRGFALDFTIIPNPHELPDGLWMPNQATLLQMTRISEHLGKTYGHLVVSPSQSTAVVCREGQQIQVQVLGVQHDIRTAFSLLFTDWEEDPDNFL